MQFPVSHSFADVHDFTWVNENTILWNEIETIAEKINKNVGEATTKKQMNFLMEKIHKENLDF